MNVTAQRAARRISTFRGTNSLFTKTTRQSTAKTRTGRLRGIGQKDGN